MVFRAAWYVDVFIYMLELQLTQHRLVGLKKSENKKKKNRKTHVTYLSRMLSLRVKES